MNSPTMQKLVGCFGILVMMVLFAEPVAGQTSSLRKASATRALVISGTPSWEYRLLVRHLSKNREWSVKTRLQSIGDNRRQADDAEVDLPGSNETFREYDVVVLIDPNPAELTGDWLGLLKRYCNEGGGLIFVAGPNFAQEFVDSDELSGLRELLPINLSDGEVTVGQDRISMNPNAQSHAVVSLTEDVETNRTLWASMPGPHWRLSASSAKPDARILLDNESDGSPLVVASDSAGGNVLFIGHSQSWRWRMVGDNAEHYRAFWNAAIKFVSRKRD